MIFFPPKRKKNSNQEKCFVVYQVLVKRPKIWDQGGHHGQYDWLSRQHPPQWPRYIPGWHNNTSLSEVHATFPGYDCSVPSDQTLPCQGQWVLIMRIMCWWVIREKCESNLHLCDYWQLNRICSIFKTAFKISDKCWFHPGFCVDSCNSVQLN